MADVCDSSALKSSCFYKEIAELPVLQSIEELYTHTKGRSRILSTGLAVLEHSVSNVFKMAFTSSSLAARVDSMAGDGVCKLKEKYPVLHTSPSEIMDTTSSGFKNTVRGVMRTPPGQVLIHGLDWALDKSENLLRRIRPRDRSPRKRKVTRSSLQKQVHLTKEHAYASEDSGACEADGDAGKAHKGQQTMLTVKDKHNEIGLVQKVYRLGVVFPLEVLVQVMRSLRRYAGGKRYKTVLTPEKKQEIGSRRKVSPKKRMQAPTSLFGRIKQRTYRLLGYKNVLSINIGESLKPSSPDREEAKEKRKYDEILTDEYSESEDDMDNFDFDNYDSEEDPDYEPDSADGSEESESGEDEAESDLETEVVKYEPSTNIEFHQLKEKFCDAKLIPKQEPASSELGTGTSVDKGDDIILEPAWKKEQTNDSKKRKSLDNKPLP
ncbi:uncharacterized protein LOC132738830 [Ruditapes philippinarum]|uniref:uncharacterized protein LOC132738830 n=1 Tax=Ruditapes philippinarum TaxID=129788 RepID=UPI00295B5F2F|nr:uncharacterized protein LOC132738830 [Ruditapes philippinarum]